MAHLDIGRKADKPEAIAVAQQAPRPHLRDGGIPLGYLVGRLDFLQRHIENIVF